MNYPLEFWNFDNLELHIPQGQYLQTFSKKTKTYMAFGQMKKPWTFLHFRFITNSLRVPTWSIWREMLSLVQNNSSNHVMIWSDRIRDTFVFCVYYIKYESPSKKVIDKLKDYSSRLLTNKVRSKSDRPTNASISKLISEQT